MSSKLDQDAIDHLNDLIKILNEHPEFAKIEVAGHSDPSEFAAVEVDDRAKDLAKKRVNVVDASHGALRQVPYEILAHFGAVGRRYRD